MGCKTSISLDCMEWCSTQKRQGMRFAPNWQTGHATGQSEALQAKPTPECSRICSPATPVSLISLMSPFITHVIPQLVLVITAERLGNSEHGIEMAEELKPGLGDCSHYKNHMCQNTFCLEEDCDLAMNSRCTYQDNACVSVCSLENEDECKRTYPFCQVYRKSCSEVPQCGKAVKVDSASGKMEVNEGICLGCLKQLGFRKIQLNDKCEPHAIGFVQNPIDCVGSGDDAVVLQVNNENKEGNPYKAFACRRFSQLHQGNLFGKHCVEDSEPPTELKDFLFARYETNVAPGACSRLKQKDCQQVGHRCRWMDGECDSICYTNRRLSKKREETACTRDRICDWTDDTCQEKNSCMWSTTLDGTVNTDTTDQLLQCLEDRGFKAYKSEDFDTACQTNDVIEEYIYNPIDCYHNVYTVAVRITAVNELVCQYYERVPKKNGKRKAVFWEQCLKDYPEGKANVERDGRLPTELSGAHDMIFAKFGTRT